MQYECKALSFFSFVVYLCIFDPWLRDVCFLITLDSRVNVTDKNQTELESSTSQH